MLAGRTYFADGQRILYNLFHGVLEHCGAHVFKQKPSSQVSRGQSNLADFSDGGESAPNALTDSDFLCP